MFFSVWLFFIANIHVCSYAKLSNVLLGRIVGLIKWMDNEVGARRLNRLRKSKCTVYQWHGSRADGGAVELSLHGCRNQNKKCDMP